MNNRLALSVLAAIPSMLAIAPSVEYSTSFANDTGYFNPLVTHAFPEGTPELVRTQDQHGRKILVLRNGDSNFVVFHRFRPAFAPTGKPQSDEIYIVQYVKEVTYDNGKKKMVHFACPLSEFADRDPESLMSFATLVSALDGYMLVA